MANNFWSPSYTGERFKDHTIPLELLEDLSVLQFLLIEIAKDIYYEENNKERVPNGFAEGVSLKLSEIGEGSSIPKITLAIAAAGTMGISNRLPYYEKAKDRIIEYIDGINSSKTPHVPVPEQYLFSFHKLGRNLFDDEAIDLSPGSHSKNAKLDKNARIRVDNRLKNKTQEPFEIIGAVPTIDKGKQVFVFEKTGTRVSCTYETGIFPQLLSAFNNYNEGAKIKLKGYGVFNNEFRLIGLKSISKATFIPAPNVLERLESFRNLEEGWLDGAGKAPLPGFIDWAKTNISTHLDFDVISSPKVYPTPEGGIQLEWTSKEYDASLEIDGKTKTGFFHLAELLGNKVIETLLDFNYAVNWGTVSDYIKEYFES